MMFVLLPVLEERGDSREFVRERLGDFRKILDFYRENYAGDDGLLSNLDKWCVVEWPSQWRDGYDVDIKEGEICATKHNVINAWYVGAVRAFNKTARRLGEREYGGEAKLAEAFRQRVLRPAQKAFQRQRRKRPHELPVEHIRMVSWAVSNRRMPRGNNKNDSPKAP